MKLRLYKPARGTVLMIRPLLISFFAVFFTLFFTVACGRMTSVSPSASVTSQKSPSGGPAGPQQQTSSSDVPNKPVVAKVGSQLDSDYVVSLVAPQKNDASNTIVDETEDYSNLIPEVDLKIPEKPQAQQTKQTPESKTPPQGASHDSKEQTKEPKAEQPPKTSPKQEDKKPAQPVPPKKQSPDINPPKQRASVAPQSQLRQALGYVDAGKLASPVSLLTRQFTYRDTPPFLVVFPSRQRFYGTTDLIESIDLLAQFVKSLSSNLRLIISDLSASSGGPLLQWDTKSQDYKKDNAGKPIRSHESHQNGLDADIAYLTNSAESQPFADIRKIQDVEATLNLEAQFKLFRMGVSTGMIDVYFVDPIMKREMCRQALRTGAFTENQEDRLTVETLQRLIVEPKWHFNHFHMRLKCDKSRQMACIPKPDMVPKEHGCVFTKKEQTK